MINRIDTGRDSLTETIETTGKFDFITGRVAKNYPPRTLVHFEKEVPSDPESRWEIICTDAKESFLGDFLCYSITYGPKAL